MIEIEMSFGRHHPYDAADCQNPLTTYFISAWYFCGSTVNSFSSPKKINSSAEAENFRQSCLARGTTSGAQCVAVSRFLSLAWPEFLIGHVSYTTLSVVKLQTQFNLLLPLLLKRVPSIQVDWLLATDHV